MADLNARRAENAPGTFYVDTSCIDCDTCRWMAPETFDREGTQSRVHTQPGDDETARRAAQALLACPTASIGTAERVPQVAQASGDFPLPIDDVVETLRAKPDGLHVICTGRNAKQELMDAADLVTEMTAIKHHFRADFKAQAGIEF